jgi:hypothetical protein
LIRDFLGLRNIPDSFVQSDEHGTESWLGQAHSSAFPITTDEISQRAGLLARVVHIYV